MIKQIFSTSLFLLLVLPLGVLAESEINWATSYMQVEFTPEVNSNVPAFSCFGFSDRSAEAGACDSYAGSFDSCVWESLETLGYSDEETAPDITNCFQQAGDYSTTIQIIDYASNESIPEVKNFTVRAGTPDPDVSVLTPDPDCNSITAQGFSTLGASGGSADHPDDATDDTATIEDDVDDSCILTLQIKDTFGNPVTQLKGATGQLFSDAEFTSDANIGDLNFRTGTKVNDTFLPTSSDTPISFTIGSDDSVSTEFEVTAWAPSIRKAGEFLGKNEPFAYDFKYVLPTVDTTGNIDLGSTIVFEFDQYSPQIGFAPWGRVLLDILAIPKEYILDADTPFEFARNLKLPSNGLGPNSPFNVLLTLHDLDPTLRIDGLNYNPVATLINAPTETLVSVLRVNGDNAQTGGNISFSTIIEYVINDGANYTIAYPSGALGSGLDEGTGADDYNDEDISTSLIGVSVEGKILGSKDSVVINDPSSFNGVQISEGDSLADIRKEVFENATRITRSIDSKVPDPANAVIDFDVSWYNNTDVVYVLDKDVAITNSGSVLNMPSGLNTLVIQNGNLIIEDELRYANNLDSFGFILINDVISKEPETGNIFIKDDVRKIVGTYYAEGGIMSLPAATLVTTSGPAADPAVSTPGIAQRIDNNNGADSQLQLIIEGTLLTHNTLGGGIYQPASDTYVTPWEILDASTDTAEKQALAVQYDLHYLRTYSPEYENSMDPSDQTNTDECYPDATTASGCYPNNAATVIRYDGRAVKTAPPGFKGATYFAR